MKRLSLYIIFILLGLPLFSQTQEDDAYFKEKVEMPPYQTFLKSNPFVMLVGAIPLTAEFRIVGEQMVARSQASQVGISYLAKGIPLYMVEDSSNGAVKFVVNGFRIQYTHKFYVGKNRNPYEANGWYIGPHFSYATSRFSNRRANTHDMFIRITHMNANIFMGYQALVKKRHCFDFFFGLGVKDNGWYEVQKNINSNRRVQPEDMSDYYRSNFKISLGFNMGFGVRDR